jgi:TetR/AcrR family transcriptional regulator
MGFSKPFEHNQALIEVALEAFIDKGYEQASINAILQAAGMSKGQFYYHFENKEDLYLALIGVLIEQKQAFLAQIMQPDDFEQDIFSIFKTQIRYGVAFAKAYPVINRFSESFLKEKGNAIYDKALAAYNFQDHDAIAQRIEMAYRKQELRQDLPLPFIKRVIGHLFTHAAEIADLNSADAGEEAMNHLIAFIQSGLTKED